MSTRDEIEAAYAKYAEVRSEQARLINAYPFDYTFWWQTTAKPVVDKYAPVLADAYLADRQQRDRDQQPPTRDMFLGLPFHMSLRWNMSLTFPVLNPDYPLETIAKLRAACLLLGIETEGVL